LGRDPTSGFLIWSRNSPITSAAIAALMSGRCSSRRERLARPIIKHVKGMEAKHMTWLKKSQPTEAWEIEDNENIGDLELARQIREICNSVADSAETVSV